MYKKRSKKLIARARLFMVPKLMDTTCGVSLNLSHLPSSTTPLHIVLWKGVDTAHPTVTSLTPSAPLAATAPLPVETPDLETNETIKRLLDRITALESMVSGLLESQKASLWFSPGLRPTPAGIEVISRRESMGAESDIGTVLSQLVRPSDVRTVSIAATGGPVAAEVEEAEAEVEEAEAEAEAEVEVEQEAEAEVEVEQEAEAEVEVEQEAEAEVEVEVEEEAEVAEVEAEGEVEVEVAEGEGEGEVEAEAEVEGEGEEEVVEYKEVQWKGHTYYVDGEQQVYEMDSDGDLIDTPIGVWREETQKLVRYKAS